MSPEQAARICQAVMAQMRKLGYGAVGPTADVLAGLCNCTLDQVTAVLRSLEEEGAVVGRPVRENGPVHWVPPRADNMRRLGHG